MSVWKLNRMKQCMVIIFDTLGYWWKCIIQVPELGDENGTWHDMWNESLVKNVNSYFLAPLSYNFNMLHFDPNPITIGFIWSQSYEEFVNAKNHKQRNLNTVLANISKQYGRHPIHSSWSCHKLQKLGSIWKKYWYKIKACIRKDKKSTSV